MRISIDVDEELWLVVPDAFPTAEGLSRGQWEESFVDQVRETMTDDWDEGTAALARAAVLRAVDAVDPADTMTLLFWPGRGLATAVVHLKVAEWRDGDEPIALEELAAGGAAIDVYSADGLGDGVLCRPYEVTGDGYTIGAIYFLVQSDSGHLLLQSDPTIPAVVGAMVAPFCELIDTLRVELEDSAAWMRPTLDARAVDLLAGEQWPALVE